MTAALLALACMSSVLPSVLAEFAGSEKAWQYVLWGAEAASLWMLLADRIEAASVRIRFCVHSICAWGAFEGAERAFFRLFFPMSHAPRTGGKDLGDVVTGLPMSWVTVLAALFLACLVMEANRARS